MTYWRIASAISSPRRMASSSLSRCTLCWTDGATARSATAKIAIIIITAISVMPPSPALAALGFAVAVIVVLVLFVRRRPVSGSGRNITRNIIRDARDTLSRLDLIVRAREGLVVFCARRPGPYRLRGGSSRSRPEKLSLVFESQAHVFEHRLIRRYAH